MTLNMLRQSQLNPELSAYEEVDSIHIFKQTPLATLEYKVKFHDKYHKRITYATHSVYVWYLVTTFHHYRCYTCYNIETGGETTPDTIYFFPYFLKMTNYSSRDMDMHAAEDLEKALQTPRTESLLQLGEYQLKAIREFTNIFDAETKIPHPH